MEDINKKLFELYSSKWVLLNDELDRKEMFDYEYNPLLLSVDDCLEYEKADLRVMLFGQDMSEGDWYKYDRKNDDLRLKCMCSIETFRNNGASIDKASKKLLTKGMGGGLNLFMREFKSNFPDKKIQFVWNDLVKMGRNIRYNPNKDILSKIEQDYFNVIIEEVRILHPDIIIFLTGPTSFWDLKLQDKFNINFNDYLSVGNLSRNELSIIDLHNSTLNIDYVFRTYHPCSRKKKKFYYNKISEIIKRKILYDEINLKLENCRMHYVNGNIDTIILNNRLTTEWGSEWVSIGRIIGKYYVCICWGLDCELLEIGIRKAPNTNKNSSYIELNLSDYYMTDNIWWYYIRTVQKSISVDFLVDEMKMLYSLIERRL